MRGQAHLNYAIGVVIFLFVQEKKADTLVQFTQRTSPREAASLWSDAPRWIFTFLRHFAAAVAAILLSGMEAFSASPFALGFVAALPTPYAITAAFGAATGYMLTQESVGALRYVAALLSAVVLNRLLYGLEGQRQIRFMPALVSFFSAFLTAAAVLTAQGLTLGGFTAMLTESLATGVLTFALTTAGGALQDSHSTKTIAPPLLPFVAFCVFLLLESLAKLTLFSVSFTRMLSVCVLLTMLYTATQSGLGALLGLAMAFAFLFDDAVGIYAILYIIASAVTGYVLSDKPYRAALVFSGTFAVGMLFSGHADHLYLLWEALGGAALFALLPKQLRRKLRTKELHTETGQNEKKERAVLCFRLHKASEAMSGVAQTVESVSAVLPEVLPPFTPEEEANAYVKQTVCATCAQFSSCRETHGEETNCVFLDLQTILHADRLVTCGDLPPIFRSRCPHAEALCDCMNRRFIRATEQRRMKRSVEELRNATAQNFKCLSTLLHTLCAEIATAPDLDSVTEELVRRTVYLECGLSVQTAVCLPDEAGHLFLELLFTDTQKALARKAEIRAALSDALSRRFVSPVVTALPNGLRMAFMEEPCFSVQLGSCSMAAEDNPYSGDTFDSFYDERGNFILVLSDGMGQGKRAALDSALAVSSFCKLYKGGTSASAALQSTNALLLLKSAEESLATLDVLIVNLYSGKTTFWKAGAAPSLIRRGDKLQRIESASLPAGILSEISFSATDGSLAAEDLVVLASDGAFDYTGTQVEAALQKYTADSVQELASLLAQTAADFSPQGHRDDITVLALRLTAEKHFS